MDLSQTADIQLRKKPGSREAAGLFVGLLKTVSKLSDTRGQPSRCRGR